jgi:hypothetical protein
MQTAPITNVTIKLVGLPNYLNNHNCLTGRVLPKLGYAFTIFIDSL